MKDLFRVLAIFIATAVVAPAISSTTHAASRARMPAETVTLDSAGRLSLGGAHSCQVNDDGTVRCWGRNDDGQLGEGSYSTQVTPVPVQRFTASRLVPLTGVVAIAAGNVLTCALMAVGTVSCWGTIPPFFGLGTAISIDNIASAVGIAAGSKHICTV